MYECDICKEKVLEPRAHAIDRHDGEGMFSTVKIKMSIEERDKLRAEFEEKKV